MFFGQRRVSSLPFLYKLLTIISVADIITITGADITEVVVMRRELIICQTQHSQKRYITFCCR